MIETGLPRARQLLRALSLALAVPLAVPLVAGCGERSPAAHVTPEPIEWPALARLVDEGIRDRITASRSDLESLEADPDTEPGALGLAYGRAGMVLMAHDLHAEARPAIANAAAYLPDDLRWAYYLAYIDAQLGETERAERGFGALVEADPDHVGSHLYLAELEAGSDRLDAAQKRLEDMLSRDGSIARAYELLGDIAGERGETPIAIANYLAALQLQPEATRLHSKLAPLYFAADMEEESRLHEAASGTLPTHYDDPLIIDVIRLNRSASFFVDQGVRFVDAGRLEEAAQHFERAIAIESDHVLALTNLALARFELGDLDGALEIGRRSVESAVAKRGTEAGAGARTEARAMLQMGTFLLAAGRDDEAETMFEDAVAAETDNAAAHLTLARFFRRSDRCEEAEEHYDQAEELDPAQPSVVVVEAALCLVRMGRDAQAREKLAGWLEKRPDDFDLRDALARVLAASPDDTVRDGRAALELAAAAEDGDPGVDALETLAMAHAELGDFEQAIEWQERAIALAEEQDRTEWRLSLEAMLEEYREGRPSRRPWPDFILTR